MSRLPPSEYEMENRHGRRAVLVAGAALGVWLTVALSGCSSSGGSGPGFWGVVPQAKTTLPQLRRLERGGVDSVRIGVDWRAVMPTRDGTRHWRDVDEIVGDASRAGLSVLPYVYRTPAWLARDENALPVETGEQRRAWMDFLGVLVRRYGEGGSFWRSHPDLPEQPIHTWQIWNEPNFFYFASDPDPDRYARLVQLSHRALRAADPGAELMLGGMFALPGERPPDAYPAYRFLATMFERHPDLIPIVDGVAIHPYTRDFKYLTPILDQVRRALRRAGDPKVRLWVTELGWGSQAGPEASQLEVGLRGQARQLGGALRLLRRDRERWRLQQVYVFTVADSENDEICSFCDSAGLFTSGFEPKPAWPAFERVSGD
jgi:polysaccharide biosynthesis protein PslG